MLLTLVILLTRFTQVLVGLVYHVLQAGLIPVACLCILPVLLVLPVTTSSFSTTSTGSTPRSVRVFSYQLPVHPYMSIPSSPLPWYLGTWNQHRHPISLQLLHPGYSCHWANPGVAEYQFRCHQMSSNCLHRLPFLCPSPLGHLVCNPTINKFSSLQIVFS